MDKNSLKTGRSRRSLSFYGNLVFLAGIIGFLLSGLIAGVWQWRAEQNFIAQYGKDAIAWGTLWRQIHPFLPSGGADVGWFIGLCGTIGGIVAGGFVMLIATIVMLGTNLIQISARQP